MSEAIYRCEITLSLNSFRLAPTDQYTTLLPRHSENFTMTGKCTLVLILFSMLAFSAQAAQIEISELSETVKVLASEEFEGRSPGGPGEEKTVSYLVKRFAGLGLKPGGENGGWTQAVPLIHTQLRDPVSLELKVGDDRQALVQSRDVEISTVRPLEQIKIDNAPVVFVGFGVAAPERGWDDFGAIDLQGKVAIFLVNDPDFAAGPDEDVAGRFGNRRMTYYGRWTYKFEEASRRGALAALVIHEDKAAGYGWNVASASPGENYSIVRSDGEAEPVTLQGWLQFDAAAKIFKNAGLELNEQRVLARSKDFQAFELEGATFSADLAVNVERIESQNILAVLPGTKYPDETLMVSAHWDAYGHGEPDALGRTARLGANDDALGTAGVLDLARVLKASASLERSVVFAVWTAEESGLLGSAAYAADPIYPLEKTVANLTLDILQTAGPARDVILVGEGQSELEGDLERAAASQGRVITPENLPENGLFFRADHFSLARRGVPVLLIMGIAGGSDLVEGGRVAGDQWIADYISTCYHQTCDAWDPDWDLRGAVQDIELFHTIINDLGNSRRWPQWKSGSEFKAIREESAGSRTQVSANAQ
jgi:Zn-dependent M28 family amino/carboxypeptidase